LASNFGIYEESWVLYHAPKLGHGADYTSSLKEGFFQLEKSDSFGRERTRDLG
jgi:hypothetical protein